MHGRGPRRVLLFSVLGVVALGALALAGVAHPHAPTGALQAYLPRLTLPTVVVAATVDGINPCAFTVLLLVITGMLAAARSDPSGSVAELRARMAARGGLFIAAIFLTYLALGLGLIGTLGMFTRRHWPARLAALFAVFMGLWMLRDYFLPGSRWRLHAPAFVGDRARAAARRGTVPALLGGGFLIGLCTVPCSGAVYLGILSMLALQPNRLVGFGYLVLYNVLFILPLVAILAIGTARPGLRWLTRWNVAHHEKVRLVLGGGVVVMGLLILGTV